MFTPPFGKLVAEEEHLKVAMPLLEFFEFVLNLISADVVLGMLAMGATFYRRAVFSYCSRSNVSFAVNNLILSPDLWLL
jgi:hypothetical protein